MNFKLFALIGFTIVSCFGQGVAQDRCQLQKQKLPSTAELFGFRLGMTFDEAKLLAPIIRLGNTDEFGLALTTINPQFSEELPKDSFPGVRSISLEFLDGSISSIWIGFNSSFKWKTEEELIEGISNALSLPKAWESRARTKQLDCADFAISASMIGGSPALRIYDKSAKERWEERRAAKDEEDSP